MYAKMKNSFLKEINYSEHFQSFLGIMLLLAVEILMKQ